MEKKTQETNGSVDQKLLTAPSFIKEYTKVFNRNINNKQKFIIHYAYILNNYFKKLFEEKSPKYVILKEILEEDDIDVMYGIDCNPNYFEELFNWIIKH